MKDIMIGESTLLGLSLISGVAGGLAGMYLFRHKIRKKEAFLLFIFLHACSGCHISDAFLYYFLE